MRVLVRKGGSGRGLLVREWVGSCGLLVGCIGGWVLFVFRLCEVGGFVSVVGFDWW